MAKGPDIREAALMTLLDMEKSGKLSHIAISDALMRLQFAPRQDRAFFTLLCEGVTERRIYLDYILDQFSRTKMKKCKPLIRNLLRMSAYQILFTNVRDAAACSEAVSLAKKKGFKGLSGFVNGVLRTLVRNKEALPVPDRNEGDLSYLSVIYSMPRWIVEHFLILYGPETTERMLASFLQVRPVTIRTNLLKCSPDELAARLGEEGVTVEAGDYFPYAFHISGFNYLGKLGSFRDGWFTVQDESSMLPAAVADLRAGDLVIDVCAAPGGKTFHAADRVTETGTVIARDLTEYKTELIKENNDRIGYDHIKTQCWDAAVYDESLAGSADLVIADLPCSGLGIMGRKNDIKYNVSRQQMNDLVILQRKILAAVSRYVKPGGQLVYSTCTINPAENEENVRWLMDHTPLRTVSIEDKLPESLKGKTGKEGCIQVLPGLSAGDGFFVAKLQLPM
ncbi:MAG: 16S rRNA (cytosine(967)-C(5))-methyltransferase RsmB [Eubacterium sp.]|nr:16S rRNA (cytosine(967)-C(5))-methyltransferase RsmB [Eubacterium sp.]